MSPLARETVEDGENEVFLSAVSVWEISIKHSLQRGLSLPAPPDQYLPDRVESLGLTQLDVRFDHAYRVAQLPQYHHDPFDRLLVAQALVENLPIISRDPHIARYDIQIIW